MSLGPQDVTPPQPTTVRVGGRPKGDEPEVSRGEWELQGAGFPPVGNWAGAAALA